MATTIIEATRTESEIKAAATLARLLIQAVKQRGKAVLGISGGKDLEGVFKQILAQEIPWKQVHVMMIDEKCVTLNSLESNYRQAHETFLKELISTHRLPEENTHPFIYDESHAIKTIIKYQSTLDTLGGFDVVLASTDENNHFAALFPKHVSIQKENRGFFLMTDAPKAPTKRMTASRKLLLKARAGILLISSKKAEDSYNDSAKTLMECPTKLINSLPEAYVFHVKQEI